MRSLSSRWPAGVTPFLPLGRGAILRVEIQETQKKEEKEKKHKQKPKTARQRRGADVPGPIDGDAVVPQRLGSIAFDLPLSAFFGQESRDLNELPSRPKCTSKQIPPSCGQFTPRPVVVFVDTAENGLFKLFP